MLLLHCKNLPKAVGPRMETRRQGKVITGDWAVVTDDRN